MRLSEIMGRLDLAFWPQAALVIFLAVFASVVWRLYAKTSREEMERAGRLPLEEGGVGPGVRAVAGEGRSGGDV